MFITFLRRSSRFKAVSNVSRVVDFELIVTIDTSDMLLRNDLHMLWLLLHVLSLQCACRHLACGRGTAVLRLTPVDAHAVALQPIRGIITRHYSRYCAVAFCYVHKNCHTGRDVKLHPYRVKLYRIGHVVIRLGNGEGTNVIISK